MQDQHALDGRDPATLAERAPEKLQIAWPEADDTPVPLPKPVVIEHVYVTPALAHRWLHENNIGNRRLRPRDIAAYIEEMVHDEWRWDSPDSVIFDWNGRLINGQNRLTAVEKSGRSIVMRVERDADPRLKDILDTGRMRAPTDAFYMSGGLTPGQAKSYSASVGMLLLWEARPEIGPAASGGVVGRISNKKRTAALPRWREQLDLFWLPTGEISRARVRGGRGTWGAMLTKFSEKSLDDALTFAEQVAHGYRFEPGSPVGHLRAKLMPRTYNQQRVPEEHVNRFIVRAWNLFRDRAKVNTLVIGRAREDGTFGPFPVPK